MLRVTSLKLRVNQICCEWHNTCCEYCHMLRVLQHVASTATCCEWTKLFATSLKMLRVIRNISVIATSDVARKEMLRSPSWWTEALFMLQCFQKSEYLFDDFYENQLRMALSTHQTENRSTYKTLKQHIYIVLIDQNMTENPKTFKTPKHDSVYVWFSVFKGFSSC